MPCLHASSLTAGGPESRRKVCLHTAFYLERDGFRQPGESASVACYVLVSSFALVRRCGWCRKVLRLLCTETKHAHPLVEFSEDGVSSAGFWADLTTWVGVGCLPHPPGRPLRC
jgi:hypothetical protein